MNRTRRSLLVALTVVAGASATAFATCGRQINQDGDRALAALYAAQPMTRYLGKRTKPILVFPEMIKAGPLIGGQGGGSALRVGDKTGGYCSIDTTSFGLQPGARTFSYGLFFMTQAALDCLQSSNGWLSVPDPALW
jgi:lipid-binding SYLF domain-containing protein